VASEVTLREIDLCVRDFVADAFAEARAILTRRRADLDQGADLLLKKEAITAEDFPAIQQTKPGGKPPARQRLQPDFFVAATVHPFAHGGPMILY
jgi:Peptidase family M41